jgi:methionine salvage enolase-phosphatase E1
MVKMNGHDKASSVVGHDFRDGCGASGVCRFVPAVLRPGGRRHTPEALEAWIAAHEVRWRVAATCAECGEELVAEEVVAHRLGHVPEGVRSLARDLTALPIGDRLAFLGLFDRKSGKLSGAE